MKEEKEEWRDVVGFDGSIKISNFGNIKSFLRNKNGNILKASDNGRGYLSARIITIKRKNIL